MLLKNKIFSKMVDNKNSAGYLILYLRCIQNTEKPYNMILNLGVEI